jgi:enoyl-CoA hydratase
MSTSPVQYQLEGTTAVVTLDDGKANALSEAALHALIAAVDRAEAEARALVLTGRPDRFCAGFDLKGMMAGPASATALLRLGSAMYLRVYGSPLPVVMACTGHALAGGALLLLTGDVRLGADGPYKLGLNEVAIGMPLPVLGVELARDRLAPHELVRATLQAQPYDPAGAARAGYLDEVVPAADLRARALAEAARLGALSRSAHGATKLRLRGATMERIRSTLDADLAELTAMIGR